MKNKDKKIVGGISASLVLLVLGLVLAIWPHMTVTIIVRAAAIALMIFGALRLIAGLGNKERSLSQNASLGVAGIIILAGFILFWMPRVIKNLIPQALALVILALGIISLLSVLNGKDRGDTRWKAKLVLPIISICGGLFILMNADLVANTGIRIVGIILVYQGASQLFLDVTKK